MNLNNTPLLYITGASSGIGQALALRYYQAGYQLALVARRTKVVEDWAEQNNIPAHLFCVYEADVSVNSSIISAGKKCLEQQGLPQVVIANAGISIGIDTSFESDIDVMAQVLQTNITGVAATFSPFVNAMKKRKSGTLVGIASVAGIRGLPGHGAYCASKSGVISYLESLRGELRTEGVQVVSILPGYIDTPLTQANSYSMPFLMPVAHFADKAFTAIQAEKSYTVIPWQMGVIAKLLRLLPNFVFDHLLAGRPRKHRQNE
jgi:short-subunit dehydrogenase